MNHAGEFGAVNIYRAQILVSSLHRPSYRESLKAFLGHEKEHREIFAHELARRGVRRCISLPLCGAGGFLLGLVTALLGRRAINACTAGVETVVLNHLESQLDELDRIGDTAAYQAVASILADEREHQSHGAAEPDQSTLYRTVYRIAGASTEAVIAFGMRL